MFSLTTCASKAPVKKGPAKKPKSKKKATIPKKVKYIFDVETMDVPEDFVFNDP
jgi:hypothetical protein